MKQIFNWTIGSFFRSIGRIVAYLVIGTIIAYLVSGGDFRRFKISELFLDHVNAEELNTYSTEWYLENGNAITSQIAGYSFQQNQNNSSGSQHNFKYYFNSNKNPIGVGSGYDYLSFNIGSYIWFTTNTSNVLTETDTYTCLINSTTSSGQNSDYKYQSITCPKTYSEEEVYEQQATYFYQVRLYYGDNSYSVCDLNSAHAGGGFVKCNLSVHKDSGLKYLSVWVGVDNFDSSIGGGSYWVKFGVSKAFNVAVSTDTQINNSINNQTQTITNTNSTQEVSEATDYFNSTNDTSQDGIKAVVSMPLNIFNALTLGSTTDLCFTLKSKQTCLPSGNIIWGKTSRTQIYSGNATFTQHAFSNQDIPTGVNNFKIIFNLVVGGYLAYKMLKSLMRITNDLLSPTKDKVEVLEL